jgi:hypothetical protein
MDANQSLTFSILIAYLAPLFIAFMLVGLLFVPRRYFKKVLRTIRLIRN